MAKISDRLRKLEESTGEALPVEALPLLVQILARRDALYWPARTAEFSLILKQRQRAYRLRELGIAAKADGRSDWKKAHRHRKALIEAGLVEALTSGGQVTSLLLKPKGESTARGLVGLPSASEVAIVADIIGPEWIHERELLGIEGGYTIDQARSFTELVLPLLAVDAVEVRCDSQKGLRYRRVEEVQVDPQHGGTTDPSPAHQSTYDAAFLAEREALESSEPLDPYEVFIPFPVGL